MNPNEKEVRDWLSENKAHFYDRTPDEIAWLAVQCLGWIDRQVIMGVVLEWARDQETRCSYRTRENWFVVRELDHTRGDLPMLWRNTVRREMGLES